MKKILLVLFVIIMASLTLVACGGEDNMTTVAPTENNSTTTSPTENNTTIPSIENNTTVSPTDDITTVHPTKNTVKVTFDSTGGSAVASQNVEKGSNVEKPSDPTKEGYIFDGWYVENEKWSFVGYVVTNDITMIAKWNPIEYNISYVLNGGTNHIENITTYTIEQGFELKDATRYGYVFLGWYTDSELTNKVNEVKQGETGGKTFYAKWEAYAYSITYVSDEDISNLSNPSSCNINDRFTLKTPLSDNKYFIFCWYTDENYSDEITTIENLEEDITLYGKWITTDKALTYKSYGYGYRIIDCVEDIDKVIIPTSYKGCPVTSIDNYAFKDCSSLINITIPNSITDIGYEAFLGCSSLTNITIPDGVHFIAQSVFQDCSSLTSVILPDSVTYINSRAFKNCSSLTNITIPNNVTFIDTGAFSGCSSLTDITIPNSVTSIGGSAFDRCTSLTEVILPNSIISIGPHAFFGCSSLRRINIPNKLTSLSNSIFMGCSSLTSINLPNSITYINQCAFANCTSLTSIAIPNSVTSIEDYTFQHCTSLESIVIPNSVTSIDGFAFYGCHSLTIYCEAETQPSNWNSSWNAFFSGEIIWGYKGN